jgi:CDP-diacylglycerol--glycerol-3-phosphate 3-phosphatidyltransferase
MLRQLPNALTVLRLVLAPIVAWAVWQAYVVPDEAALASPRNFDAELSGAQSWALAAAVLFILAALTDLFDGWAARALQADSKFGRLIDPIADKALVGLPLIAISVIAWRGEWPLWWAIAASTAVIVLRDLIITLLRFTSADGEGARVSQLAKWKTAAELIAVGVPILFAAAPAFVRIAGLGEGFAVSDELTLGWIGLLALAALLSAVTAFQYLMARPVRG